MRSATDSKLAGICGGFAEYMDADPTLIRLLWVIATFFTGVVPGILAYAVAWLIIPVAPIYIPAPASGPQASAESPRPA